MSKRDILDEAAQQFERGRELMTNALKVLGPSDEVQNAMHYFSTSMLWSAAAFNSKAAAIDAEEADASDA